MKSPRKVCTKAKSEGAATPKRLQLYRESSIPKEWLMAKKALQTGQNDVQYVGREKQVWPLTLFFLFAVFKINLPGGNDPLIGEGIVLFLSFQQLSLLVLGAFLNWHFAL